MNQETKTELDEINESDIRIFISKDHLEAYLEILPSKNGIKPSYEEVYKKINESGIVFGLDDNQIKNAITYLGRKVVFARGKSPQDGKNAYIMYNVNREEKGRPTVLANGKVDFKSLNLYTAVAAETVVAEKIPCQLGEDGIDVLGRTVAARKGKDIPMPHGKNIKIIDNKIISAISGQLLINNGRIDVIPVIEIKGDIDLSTGNIEFPGNVVVQGSVQNGFSVKAGGNVEINGTVSGGTVEGNNVIIRSGIQGMHTGYIRAQENVVAKFAEHAVIYAGNDVLVNDVVLHSRISAGKRVVVDGKKGLVAGGYVSAGEEIILKTVGTQFAPNTTLEAGINPMLREEYQQLRKDFKKVNQSLEQAKKALAILSSMDPQSLSNQKREMLLKLTKTKFSLASQAESMCSRIQQIESMFEEMRNSKIRISDSVYPGVKIVIGTLVKPVREFLRFVSFYAEDGDIKISTFK